MEKSWRQKYEKVCHEKFNQKNCRVKLLSPKTDIKARILTNKEGIYTMIRRII